MEASGVMMDVSGILGERKKLVEPLLLEYIKIGDEGVQKMLSHPIKAGGKRIRPALLLLSCEAVGGDPKKILSAAASVELLHTFTLVHDDIMDHDAERRGKPTVHALWGGEMGIIVGDTLYSTAFKALVDTRKNVGSERVLDAVEVLVWANGQLQEGQILDMMYEKKKNITEREYMTMIEKKTGVLFEASMRIGCILGGGTKEQGDALGSFGRNIGLAFQIKDDLLDLTADEKKLGKPVGSDIRRGKNTLVVAHAMSHAGEEAVRKMRGVLGKRDAGKKEVYEVLGLLGEAGSLDYAKARVDELLSMAKNSLRVLSDSKARESLAGLAGFVGERGY